jgi:CRP-like cAMP-binding protein
MPSQFEGSEGGRKLLQAFAEQEIVQHDDAIAGKMAAVASVKALHSGETLYQEGEAPKHVLFFILDGGIDLTVQGKHLAALKRGQAVGEFPIIDPSLNYTVTAQARDASIVASVLENDFLSIAQEHPALWKNMAKMLVTRMRQANKS